MTSSVPARPRPRGRLLAALTAFFALVAGLIAPVAFTASPAVADEDAQATRSTFDRPVRIEHGHVDGFYFNVGANRNPYIGEGEEAPHVPYLALKDDTVAPYEIRRPDDVEMFFNDSSHMTFPDAPGVPEPLRGRDGYYMPLSQHSNPTVPWVGWESQPLRGSGYDAPLDIRVSDVEGPGEVFLWTQASLDPAPRSLLRDGGFQLPGAIAQDFLAHVHTNWVFTEPGDYWFTVTGEVTDVENGSTVFTNTEMYLFTIDDVHSRPVDDLTITEPAASYDRRESVRLEAAATPAPEGATWSWQWMLPGQAWETIEGQDTATYEATAADEHELYYLRAVLTVGETRVPTVPVRIEVEQRLPDTIEITGAAPSYHPADTVELTANPHPELPDLSWQWESALPGEDFAPVEGQTSNLYRADAGEQGHFLRAVASHGNASVASEPIEIVVEIPPEVPDQLTIDQPEPVAEGESFSLNARPNAGLEPFEDVVFVWESSADGQTWEEDGEQRGATYFGTATAELDGRSFRAELFIDGQSVAISNEVTLKVIPAPVLPESVVIEGLANPYAAGDSVELTAVPEPSIEGEDYESAYQWQQRLDEDGEWDAVQGQDEAVFESAAETDGQQIRVILSIEEHDAAYTSEPVTLEVEPADEPGPDPSDPPLEPGVCWDEYRLDRGHTDIFYFNVDDSGRPYMALKDDTVAPYAVRAPEEVELHVREQALEAFPDSENVPEGLRGQEAYYLPLTQQDDLLWPGWESQPLSSTIYDQVDIHVHTVQGPGDVYLWTTGSFGQGVGSLLDDGSFTLPGTIHQSFLAHVHGNWAFTEPGVYYLTANATLRDSGTGETFVTNSGHYAFTVGDDLPENWQDCVRRPEGEPQPPATGDLTEDNRGDVSLDPLQVRAGEQVTVTSPSLVNAYAAAFLHSEPISLTGWTRADGDGSFVAAISADAPVGDHRLSVVDAESEFIGWTELEVLPATPRPTPDDDDQDDDRQDDDPARDGNGSGNGNGNGPGATGTGRAGTGGAGNPQCLASEQGQGSGNGSGPGGASSNGNGNGGAAPSGEVVYGNEGHFDFGPIINEGSFELQVKDDRTAPPIWRDPDTVVFVLDENSRRAADTVPEELSFIAPSGQDIWMIQQIQEPGVPWLGWNTQHETIVNGPGADGVQLTLDLVTGPGEVAVFMNGNFGSLLGERVVDTVGGPQSYAIPANTHQHGNWVFTEPGDYAMTFTVAADGESDTGTLRFSVGQDDPSTAAQISTAGLSAQISTAGSISNAPASIVLASDDDADAPDEDAAREGQDDPAPVAEASSQPSAGNLPAGWGLTAGGEPCRLASTGIDGDSLSVALAGMLAVLLGATALVASRRFHARR